MSLRLEFSGSPVVRAAGVAVWRRLVDPEFITRSAPGVTSVKTIAPNKFEATAMVGIGPMRLPLTITIELFDLVEPDRGRLTASADVSGSTVMVDSSIQLTALEADRTRLAWTATTTLDGPLALLGADMIEGMARKLTENFWTDFARRVEAEETPAAD